MKKQICFVQANYIYGDAKKTTYFPYAVGCIQAYCLSREKIRENFEFTEIVYTRISAEEICKRLNEPYMVLFSCSVWNFEYNKFTSKKIKECFPNVKIVFGGHNISADGKTLEECPWVDFLTHRYGEEPTADLIECLLEKKNPADIPNISYRDNNNNIFTTQEIPQCGTDYPSPYLTGIFDGILNDDISFSALLETNRGCPNQCAFCDWGALKSKVRLFPMQRVLNEIDWFAKNKIEYVFCTDGNFCLFKRDEEIADYIIASKKNTGYPVFFRVCFTKNKFDFVLNIGKKLVSNGLDRAQTISFQSVSQIVNKNVGRQNISMEYFRALMKSYHNAHITTHTELIAGLPGETYESFCSGICSLIENGQHFAISVYACELLPNSLMGQKDYIEKYKIKSVRVPYKQIHTSALDTENITEFDDYVISTYSMSENDWIEMMVFASFVQALHNLGLTRNIAIYYRYEQNISYLDFYNNFLNYAKNAENTLINRVYHLILQKICGIVSGKNEMVSPVIGIPNMTWSFEEIIYLEFFKQIDIFYDEISQMLNIGNEDDEKKALVIYQSSVIKRIEKNGMLQIASEYDFYGYFNSVYENAAPLLKKSHNILLIDDVKHISDLPEYAREILWYGRNRRETDYTAGFYKVQQKFIP